MDGVETPKRHASMGTASIAVSHLKWGKVDDVSMAVSQLRRTFEIACLPGGLLNRGKQVCGESFMVHERPCSNFQNGFLRLISLIDVSFG